MHQLDVLISDHQREWEGRMREMQDELKLRDKELTTLRISLQERTDQVRTNIYNHQQPTTYLKFYVFLA
jgi:hypothetical protein